MTVDPDRIFVAGDAHLYIGPVGAAMPTDPAADFGPDLIEVGYFSDDSLQFSYAPSFDPVIAHQSNWPAAYLQTSDEATVAVDLQEWSAENFRLAFAGGQAADTGGGIWRYSPRQITDEYEFSAVVRVRDGQRTYALVIPRAGNFDGMDLALGKTAAATLPVTITVNGPAEDRWYWLTDDAPGWGTPPDPVMWYRAADLAGGADSEVTSFPSAVPGGGPALTTVAPFGGASGGPPLLRLAAMGSRQGVEFCSGGSHPPGYMVHQGGRMYVPVSPGFSLTATGGLTVFAVMQINAGAGGVLSMTGAASSLAARSGYFIGNPAPSDGQALFRTYTSVTDNVPYIFEWRYSHGPSADVAYRRDGADQSVASNDDSPSPLTGRSATSTYDTAAGADFGFTLGDNLNGILYELRIYDGVLSGATLTQVRAELAAAYGLNA